MRFCWEYGRVEIDEHLVLHDRFRDAENVMEAVEYNS